MLCNECDYVRLKKEGMALNVLTGPLTAKYSPGAMSAITWVAWAQLAGVP